MPCMHSEYQIIGMNAIFSFFETKLKVRTLLLLVCWFEVMCA